MGVRLMTAVERLPKVKLEKVKHAIAVGDYDTMMRIVKAEGYDGSDGTDPKSVGEKVKRMVR